MIKQFFCEKDLTNATRNGCLPRAYRREKSPRKYLEQCKNKSNTEIDPSSNSSKNAQNLLDINQELQNENHAVKKLIKKSLKFVINYVQEKHSGTRYCFQTKANRTFFNVVNRF